MLFNVEKKDPAINIVIITGSCCIPGMAALDQEAGRIVERAALATGAHLNVRLLPVSKAMFGGVPKDASNKLMGEYQSSGKIGLPAILINGKLVTYGTIDYESVKNELMTLNNEKNGGQKNE